MDENNLNFKDILDELLEYKKLNVKLEKELISKNNEYSLLLNKSNNLKQQYENKITELENEINVLKEEKRKFLDINFNTEKEKDDCIFQLKQEIEKLKRLNSSTNYLVQNKNELNQKILEIEKIKNEEISALRAQILQLNREKNNIEMEFREYKAIKPNDIKMINEKDKHNFNFGIIIENKKNEMKKSIESMNEQVRKNENNNNNKILELSIEQYKEEKNNYLKDLKIMEEKHLNEVNILKEKNESLNNKIILLNNDLSYKEAQLYEIQRKFDKLNIENKALENNNNILLVENDSLKDEGKHNINNLSNLINKREEEIVELEDRYKNNIKKLRKDIKEYKNKIYDKEKENFELKNKINKINEEKKLLVDKMMKIQKENENNSAYFNSNKKAIKEIEKDNYIVEKEEEINNLNKYISKIKKEYFDAIEKKKYYKKQCKIFNDKIDVIKNNISKEQLQKIEKEIMEKGNNIDDNKEDI